MGIIRFVLTLVAIIPLILLCLLLNRLPRPKSYLKYNKQEIIEKALKAVAAQKATLGTH